MSGLRDRIRGCLLAGAAGDALGAPVEFMALDEIRRRFGPGGIQDFSPAYGVLGAITDDTQMTLFTAEGLLRAWVRGNADLPGAIHHAYLRWLLTQGMRPRRDPGIAADGWLFGLRALHDRRAPGNTCLSALVAAEGFGLPNPARNDSKGCGGVMRAAPVGLFAPGLDADAIFGLGAEACALTHGHPSGYLTGGHLAVTVARLLQGDDLPAALDAADAELRKRPHHAETRDALAAARALAATRPTPEALETLGGGWVAEEALAIAICCALAARDLRDGLVLAANHSGDSDSTAAIAGNLLGARDGEGAIPPAWLAQLELAAEIRDLADDLHDAATGTLAPDAAAARYPGW